MSDANEGQTPVEVNADEVKIDQTVEAPEDTHHEGAEKGDPGADHQV